MQTQTYCNVNREGKEREVKATNSDRVVQGGLKQLFIIKKINITFGHEKNRKFRSNWKKAACKP